MWAKVLVTALSAALAYVAARQIRQFAAKAASRVQTAKDTPADRVTTLREDPDTGVFHPVDRD